MPTAPVSPFSQFSMEDYDPNAPAPPQQMAAPAAPGAVPSSPPSALQPMVGSSTPPQVFSPLDVAEKPDLARLQKLKEQDANPYGSASNHPGTMGKILHGLSIAGQIAGGVFAPHLMADIPGTEAYRNLHEQQLGKEINDIEREKVQNQASQAETAAKQQETQFNAQLQPGKVAAQATDAAAKGAETDEAKARTNMLGQQAAQIASSSAPLDENQAAALNSLYAPIAKASGMPAGAFKPGMPPALRDAAIAAMQAQAKLHEEQVVHEDAMRWQGITHADSEKDRALNRQIALQNHMTAETEGTYNKAAGYWRSQADAVNKQSQAAQAALNDINQSNIGQAIGRIKELSSGAAGQGSGVRITQTEINSLGSANGIQGDVSAFLNRMQGKGPMSDQEKRQAIALTKDIINLTQQKLQKYQAGLDDMGHAKNRDEILDIDSRMRRQLWGEGEDGGASAGAGKPPAGATGKGMGPDKKMHWTNKNGDDLGVAE